MSISTDDCWLWAGAVSDKGYGFYYTKVDGKWRARRAHRLVYESEVGEIPDGLVLDHLCRNKICINPRHLEPVSTQENIARGDGSAALNARKSHCKRGHEFTPENTLVKGGLGWRVCRTCHNARRMKSYYDSNFPGKWSKKNTYKIL